MEYEKKYPIVCIHLYRTLNVILAFLHYVDSSELSFTLMQVGLFQIIF